MTLSHEPRADTFNITRLALHWSCSEGLVRKLLKNGQLKGFKIGNLWRIKYSEVENYECRKEASSPSNGLEADGLSSTKTIVAHAGVNALMRPIGKAPRRKRGSAGALGSSLNGPWVE